MFVINEDCEILNLAQCIKIVVIKSEIKAYAPVWDSGRSTHLVAKFDTEVEAGYAYFDLYKSLKAGKRTWDPYAIKPPSTLWDKIAKFFPDDDIPYELTQRAVISAFSLDKVTITYPAAANRHFSEKTVAKCQKKVARKLRELLGDSSIEVEWIIG